MRRFLAWLLVLTLLLCGCGRTTGETQKSAAAETVPGVDAKTGEWIGQGGCYTLSEADSVGSSEMGFLYHGERGYVLLSLDDEDRIMLGDRELARSSGEISGADAGDNGIWYSVDSREKDGPVIMTMIRLDGDGTEEERLELRFPENCFPRTFKVMDDCICLNCSDRLRIYDTGGAQLFKIPHEEWKGKLIKGGDGAAYYVEEKEPGGSVSRVDVKAGALAPLFDYSRGTICAGDGESPLLLACSEGIYHLFDSGETAPLVIWEECGLAVSGVSDVQAEPDGSYLLRGLNFSALRMTPAEPGELRPRVRVRLGVMGLFGELPRAVAHFNARSTDCCVELVDLTEGGLSAADALTRLSTLIAAGEGPDMLAFNPSRGLSPFPYLRKGLLRDLEADLQADGEIAPQELLITEAVKRDCGGLYLLASGFYMETRLGLKETFGDAKGWSFDAYLALARATPSDRMVMYNLTRDYFLKESASCFLRRAIDWENGSCNLDNPEFRKLLTAVRDVVETPEDPNNMVFGSNLLADGYMLTELTMVNSVTALARSVRHVGKPVSIVGFPTPDGSCGTDMNIYPVGVLNSSAHPEACLAFLKDWLRHPNQIPAYRPLFETEIDKALHTKPDASDPFTQYLDPPLTQDEAQQLRELIAAVEHTTLVDETALNIIREETAAFLAGQRSAEDTARLIQSRVSLYVSEQA